MRGVLLSLVRHLAAVAVGFLAAKLALTDEQAAQATETAVAIMLAGYAVAEKSLKPLFFRYFGELLPGEVPPASHDAAKVKEGVS